MPLFVYVLGLAVFAQGTSEFMASGLVPGIAGELSVPVGAAAALTSAYAVGMIVGAPAMALLSARWPRRRALAGFLTAFVVVHVIGAVTTSFPLLFGTRVVAAVVNAGFLAVAMPVAVALAPQGKQARATGILLAGITLSCVAGVPAGAVLGDLAGWRSAFWAVAALCLPALILVFRSAPADAASPPEVSIGRELRELKSPPVRHAMLLGALVNGATFTTFAFLAIIATDVAHLPAEAVSGLLAAFGVGAFLGVTVAGRKGNGELRRGLVFALCALPVGWAALAATGTQPIALFVLATVQGGLSFGCGSALIARVIHVAPGAPALGGSFATVAFNVGAFVGPVLAGFVTEATGDYRDAVWISAAVAVAALPLVLRRGWVTSA
ncbi:Cmx/CmrA family chloramphenicol efflux MFS transporter [Amycolatopsis sp. EV170708-02-1]|uniref:Cmx/CmrA family chloramphenicol efflux MFS transporter n=1 Tax=Amycolatopsis sp. EV170708-02-1 TaxID=2919322 RepID=UPI001F0BD74E|nr:Cmx/CmrA family chloramphenicol efflux MFS transporter [Amycolatopsis sp. EV170708-02-1]UMP04649.1 MFS transporter [Amycolatopsis sp. EV170708-02-1]